MDKMGIIPSLYLHRLTWDDLDAEAKSWLRETDLSRVFLRGANLRRANLAGVSLSGANLSRANLYRASLYRADLRRANLHRANLGRVLLRRADLRKATLARVNLREARLGEADLREACLVEADLRGANLRGANLYGADLPAPTMMLFADWGEVSDDLCRELMRFDASCHGAPESFNGWAEDERGECPFSIGGGYERGANFRVKRELWSPELLKRPSLSPHELVQRLIEEVCDSHLGVATH